MRKKFLCTVLSLAMAFSTVPNTALAADNFVDISGHWAESQIKTWADRDVINGNQGFFHPNDYITRGEAAVIINRLMGYLKEGKNSFSDLPMDKFYSKPVLNLIHAGVMSGYPDKTVRPTEKITRQETVVMLSNAFGISTEETEGAVSYTDAEKIASFALDAVNVFTAEGYIHGDPTNCFQPTAPIKRSEFVVILNNMISSYLPADGQVVSSDTGIMLINQPNVTVSNKMADTIFIAAGVGEGNVTLDDVQSETLIVKGGGENSVIIKGNSSIKIIHIAKQDAGVRVRVEGNAKVDIVHIDDGCDDVILSGSYDVIAVDSSQNQIRLVDADVKNLTIVGENVKMHIDKESSVETLSVGDHAANTEVISEGNVKNVNINNPSAKVEVEKESGGSTGGSSGSGSGGGSGDDSDDETGGDTDDPTDKPVITMFGLTLCVTEGGSAYAEEVTDLDSDDEDTDEDDTPPVEDPIDPEVDGYPLMIQTEGKGIVIAVEAEESDSEEELPEEEKEHILRLEIIGQGTIVVEEIGA